MKRFSRYHQEGFSLIEVLLVVGIIAVLAIAAFVIFPQVQAASRANTEFSNIQTILVGTRTLYKGRYGNAPLTGIINEARIVPVSMNGGDFSSGVALTSSWGGEVTIEGNGTGGARILLFYGAVPDDVCLKLLPGVLKQVEQIHVGDPSSPQLTPASPAGDIVAACNADDEQDWYIISR